MSKYISKASPIRAIKWTGENVDEMIRFLGDCYLASNGNFIFFKRGRLTSVEVAGTCGICGVGNYIIDDSIFTAKKASDFEKDYMEFEEENENV